MKLLEDTLARLALKFATCSLRAASDELKKLRQDSLLSFARYVRANRAKFGNEFDYVTRNIFNIRSFVDKLSEFSAHDSPKYAVYINFVTTANMEIAVRAEKAAFAFLNAYWYAEILTQLEPNPSIDEFDIYKFSALLQRVQGKIDCMLAIAIAKSEDAIETDVQSLTSAQINAIEQSYLWWHMLAYPQLGKRYQLLQQNIGAAHSTLQVGDITIALSMFRQVELLLDSYLRTASGCFRSWRAANKASINRCRVAKYSARATLPDGVTTWQCISAGDRELNTACIGSTTGSCKQCCDDFSELELSAESVKSEAGYECFQVSKLQALGHISESLPSGKKVSATNASTSNNSHWLWWLGGITVLGGGAIYMNRRAKKRRLLHKNN
jgi:hypothetical protein